MKEKQIASHNRKQSYPWVSNFGKRGHEFFLIGGFHFLLTRSEVYTWQ